MDELLERCYGQTLQLKRDTGFLKAELCLALIPLVELQKKANKFLHPKELAYLDTLSFEKRRLGYLLGRFVAKQAVSRYLGGVPLHEILIENAVFQFPVIHYPGNEKIQVTDSHTDQCGIALAFPEVHPMGIDLELVDGKRNDVIATQLIQEEKDFIETSGDPRPEKLYALFWTMKEAVSKALRTGLTSPFSIYAVKNLKNNNGFWSSEFKNFGQYQAVGFSLEQFMCSIVCPRRTELLIDIPAIQNWLKEQK